jgi:hypothetical protein
MAVLSHEDFMKAINAKFGEDTSPETLELIANVSDTLTDLETRAAGEGGYKKKYEDLAKTYKERFMTGGNTKPPEQDEPEDDAAERITIADLFKPKK